MPVPSTGIFTRGDWISSSPCLRRRAAGLARWNPSPLLLRITRPADAVRPLRLRRIGATGFEPAASCSQSRRSSQAELRPGATTGIPQVNVPSPSASSKRCVVNRLRGCQSVTVPHGWAAMGRKKAAPASDGHGCLGFGRAHKARPMKNDGDGLFCRCFLGVGGVVFIGLTQHQLLGGW